MPSPVHPVRSHPSYTYATILQSHNPAPPPSTVHLRNLTFALPIGANPWGPSVKPNQNFHQPILLSARVVLRHAFDTASATDTVDASTIHYGILSKSILKCVEEVKGRGDWPMWSVSDFLDWLVWRLTGIDCISNVDVQKTRSERDLEEPALLQPSRMRELEFSVCLKKGSLKAAAIVLTKRYAFLTEGESEVCTSSVLKLEGIRISTLIGVNANERTATQTVEACVEIDPYACVREDYYPQLEDIVFRVCIFSSDRFRHDIERDFANSTMIHRQLRNLHSKHWKRWCSILETELYDFSYVLMVRLCHRISRSMSGSRWRNRVLSHLQMLL